MNDKERFQSAFEYLRKTGTIRTQRQLAELMSSTEANVSKALKGDERVLTSKFVTRFCQTFPNIFNLNWLLTGEGEMLLNTPSQPKEKENNDYARDLIAAKNETIAILKARLEEKDELIKDLRLQLRQLQQFLNSSRPVKYTDYSEAQSSIAADKNEIT